MEKKETTIDDLAIMIKHGFDQVATKDELRGLDQRLDFVDQRLDKLEEIQKDIFEELNATHADVAYMRRTLDPMVRNDIAQDEVIENLGTRVERLEHKAKFA
ncbi:MAG: hypothetical protein HY007_03430 [Candidatus Sungbacteria bacterium]|nr:hypothetical protein [Candidatus Sungbacteria bacterium]